MQQWQIGLQQQQNAHRSAVFNQQAAAHARARKRRQQRRGGRPVHPLWRAIGLAVRLAFAAVFVAVALFMVGAVQSAMDEGTGFDPGAGETAP